jgi:hypothetical protein
MNAALTWAFVEGARREFPNSEPLGVKPRVPATEFPAHTP